MILHWSSIYWDAVQNASYPRSLYGRLSYALQLIRVIGDTAICFRAVVDSPASMATLADFIARCEGLNTVIISSPIENDYFITVRSRQPDRHAGELAEALTSVLGSGGGHAERAAGSIPITNEYCNQDMQNELLRRWKSQLNLTDIPELPFLTTWKYRSQLPHHHRSSSLVGCQKAIFDTDLR